MAVAGIYPFGQGISLVSKLNEFFRDACPITAPAVLKFPVSAQQLEMRLACIHSSGPALVTLQLFRHLMGAVGAVPSSKEGMEEAMRKKTNLLLVPGGVRSPLLRWLSDSVQC
jgi:hypothetical protein